MVISSDVLAFATHTTAIVIFVRQIITAVIENDSKGNFYQGLKLNEHVNYIGRIGVCTHSTKKCDNYLLEDQLMTRVI